RFVPEPRECSLLRFKAPGLGEPAYHCRLADEIAVRRFVEHMPHSAAIPLSLGLGEDAAEKSERAFFCTRAEGVLGESGRRSVCHFDPPRDVAGCVQLGPCAAERLGLLRRTG